MKKYFYLSLTFLTVFSQRCFAADAFSSDVQNALQHNTNEPSIMQIIFALLFVICLIYVTGLIYSKLNILGAKTVKEQLKNYDLSNVVVLSTTQLGQGKNLHVIEIDNKRMLIGATQNSIHLIKEFSDSKNLGKNIIKNDNIIKEKSLTKTAEKSEKKVSYEKQAEEPELVEEFTLHKKYL